MNVQPSRRLPGLRFEVQPSKLDEALPRMDIAVFVGFAASGPLHTPVPIEDVAHFTEIFGSAAPLAWDAVRGEMTRTQLARAVRSFFRNGGRRCWVVRVADPQTATVNHFVVPGLTRVKENRFTPACAFARSEGSWSDALRISATLESRPLEVASVVSLADPAIHLKVTSNDMVVVGDLLRLTFREEQDSLLFVVHAIEPQPALSPPNAPARHVILVKGRVAAWLRGEPASPPERSSPPASGALPTCEQLTFALFARLSNDALFQVSGLGFAPAHPRYWGYLPSDTLLYAPAHGASDPRGATPAEHWRDPSLRATLLLRWRDAIAPRFPLAGDNDQTAVYLPIDMPAMLDEDRFVGRLRESPPECPDLQLDATPLERDGLAKFAAGLFLDPHLAETGVRDLITEADYLRFGNIAPRQLTGIHAALGIEEATLIAVPDAAHAGWVPAMPPPRPDDVEFPPLLRPAWWHDLDCEVLQRAMNAQVREPNSATDLQVREPRHERFLDCSTRVLPIPVFTNMEREIEDGNYTLSWTWAAVEAAEFTLEQASRSDFRDAVVIHHGNEMQRQLFGLSPGDRYYRVRASADNDTSDWSTGIVVRVAPRRRWVTPATEDNDFSALSIVQRALLRMCAARGDLFAVLSLPEGFRENDAMAHATSLKSPTLDAAGSDDERTFSFGGLFYPWHIEPQADDVAALHHVPPDGAACGILAKRAFERGVWVAPANEPLKGVLALTKVVSPGRWAELQTAQINLLRHEPRGFLWLAADTLSDDPDLRQINVRRLLSLLRRLALKHGAMHVFEPNDATFRRAVQRDFEALLGRMFLRGAFAGRTASDAFRVVTDNTINPPQGIDQGRFMVELRVAPSRPLAFLTVRLVQMNDRAFVAEGR